MKVHALVILAGLLAASAASAQTREAAVIVDAVEAVVTIVDVDREARVVLVRGPRGNEFLFDVPPESQNLDEVRPGSRFKVRYLHSVAVSIARGGNATGSASRSVQMAPKGDVPGGVITTTRQVSGTVETLDVDSRLMSVRGPEGRTLIFTVDETVQGLEQVQPGDVISVEYAESVAMRMIQQ
jgi:hypothetical protein